MVWRLSIDFGSNSLGFAVLELCKEDGNWIPCGLLDSGVRIFSDGRNPKDKQSNAAKRREPRSARKNRDRYKRRRDRLMRQLVYFGLMPEDKRARKALEGGKEISPFDSDPWILRARGLDEAISAHQFGRAIFHLHQRRGFKSNRKADRGDNEKGKVNEAISRTNENLKAAGARTIGAYYGSARALVLTDNGKLEKGDRNPLPLARVRKSGEGAKWQYDYYPTRDLILEEFDLLWEKQRAFHGALLIEEARKILRDTLAWQHPLKAQPVGKCTLMPELPRAPKALPSSQRARILQEVNHLRLAPSGHEGRALTLEERDIIAASLLRPSSKTAKRTFDQIRKMKGISIYDAFNTETEKKKGLVGDVTAATLMQKEYWGDDWFDLDLATQDEIVDRLLNEEDEKILVKWLCETHGLDEAQAYRVADCSLPDGHGNLSKEAIAAILPFLQEDVTVYSDAVKMAGMDHSYFSTGEVHDRHLPYYGYVLERAVAFGTGKEEDPDEKRYGKVANPTVHVALNQLRQLVNDLLKRYGVPEQIVLELSRNLPLSAKGKSELERKQRKNQEENERRARELNEEFGGQRNSYENRMRLRLYEELDVLGKRCVYTGQAIGGHNLFSGDVEIEHILPFSRTFDDSFNNKTLSMRTANRDKGNKTPHEAFSRSPPRYDWEEIAKRASELSPGKRWRFGPDAMERYEEFEGGFIARQLTDTQYISRLAQAYLESIYGGQGHKGGENHVWAINGRLTADLRHHWGLNSILKGDNLPEAEAAVKNRDDHRHHAIDAVVIGCTDRSMLQKAARKAKENETQYSSRLLAGIAPPWEGFRNDVEATIRNIIVSHKPDHGFQGAMHNDTAYGLTKGKIGEPDKKGVRLVVTRKPLESFEKPGDLETIRDHDLKLKFLEATYGLSGADFKEALRATARAMRPPVYKLRVEEKLNVIPIQGENGKAYKGYKGDSNYCYDIWLDEKSRWTGEVISTFQAYQLSRADENWWRKLQGLRGQKLLMRLRKSDYLQITHEERLKIVHIYKFSKGTINMAEHFESNVDARVRARELKTIAMAPSSLQKAGARRVTLSPSGQVKTY